jgi:hypothetical protein
MGPPSALISIRLIRPCNVSGNQVVIYRGFPEVSRLFGGLYFIDISSNVENKTIFYLIIKYVVNGKVVIF